MHHNENEINLKDFLSILLNYKKSIIIFVILGIILSNYIVYFKPNIYQAQTLLKITFDRQGYYDDFLTLTPSNQNSQIEDELVVLQSNPIAQKTIKKLNIGTRYFTINGYKEIEFYQNAPFSVSYTYISPLLYGARFIIKPLGDKRFILEVNTNEMNSFIDKLKSIFTKEQTDKENFSFHKIYQYGEHIQSKQKTLYIFYNSQQRYGMVYPTRSKCKCTVQI
jgi:hypothetical protein